MTKWRYDPGDGKKLQERAAENGDSQEFKKWVKKFGGR
jgi:hypothetical protein